MPFGKYKNRELEDIPTDYLRWLRDKVSLRDELADAIDAELAFRYDQGPGCW
jgi:uncharacterized protein (DUF3820 family)